MFTQFMLYTLSSDTDNIWDIFQGSHLSELLTGLELSFTDGLVGKQMAVSLTFKIFVFLFIITCGL